MLLTVECPDELLDEVALPAVMTGTGVALEAVEEVPAWAAARLSDGVEELATRPSPTGARLTHICR